MSVYGTGLYGSAIYGADPITPVTSEYLRVDMWWSGAWHDVTSDVLVRDGVQLFRGRSSEDSSGAPASCSFSLQNRAALYSPRNSGSALYGLIGRNTPVRVGVGRPSVATVATGTGTTMTAPSVTAEVEGQHIVFYASAPTGNFTMPGGYTASGEEDGNEFTARGARLDGVAAGATTPQDATTTVGGNWAALSIHIPGATGKPGLIDLFINGADVNLSPTVAAGDTVTAVCAWMDPDGRMEPPKLEGDPGAGWTLLADSGPSEDTPRLMAWSMVSPDGAPGEFSLVGARDGASDAMMALFVSEGALAWSPRFAGEIAEFPQRWDHSLHDYYVPVEAAGVLRRIGQSDVDVTPVEASFLLRDSLVAYWPLTDADGATAFTNLVSGGAPMAFAKGSDGLSPDPELAAYTGFAGSLPTAVFDDAGASGPVSPAVDTQQWAAGCIVSIPAGGTAAGANLFTLEFSGGSISALIFEYTSNTNLTRKVVYSDGTATSSGNQNWSSFMPNGIDGGRMLVHVTVIQDGADIDWAFKVLDLGTQGSSVGQATGTEVGRTLGVPSRFSVGVELGIGSTLHNSDVSFGHAFVVDDIRSVLQSTDPTLGAGSVKAFYGWNGDKTTDRIYRLARDAGYLVQVRHNDVETLMGTQSTGSLESILRECENASSGGRLSDAAGFPGLVWRDRPSKESQDARLSLALDGPGVLGADPTDDDRLTVNDWTIDRSDGGSGRYVDAASVAAVGRYAQQETLSLELQADAPAHAAWRVHLGTVDEPRWPQVSVIWARIPSDVDDGMALRIGDRVTLTGLPDVVGGGTADLIVEGVRDSFDSKVWVTEYVCVPFSPWAVGVVDADDERWDTVGDADDPDAYPPVYVGLG